MVFLVDVFVFTLSTPIWHIHWRALHIMGDTAVPWFGPMSAIGHQGPQKRPQNDVDDDDTGNTATMDG